MRNKNSIGNKLREFFRGFFRNLVVLAIGTFIGCYFAQSGIIIVVGVAVLLGFADMIVGFLDDGIRLTVMIGYGAGIVLALRFGVELPVKPPL